MKVCAYIDRNTSFCLSSVQILYLSITLPYNLQMFSSVACFLALECLCVYMCVLGRRGLYDCGDGEDLDIPRHSKTFA